MLMPDLQTRKLKIFSQPTSLQTSSIDGDDAQTPNFRMLRDRGSPLYRNIEDWAKSESIELYDGWKVDIAREAKRRALAPSHSFEPAVIEKWGKMFDDLLS